MRALLCLPPAACSEQYPLAEGRLHELINRIAPTNAAAKAFRELREHIEAAKVGGSAGWLQGSEVVVAGAAESPSRLP